MAILRTRWMRWTKFNAPMVVHLRRLAQHYLSALRRWYYLYLTIHNPIQSKFNLTWFYPIEWMLPFHSKSLLIEADDSKCESIFTFICCNFNFSCDSVLRQILFEGHHLGYCGWYIRRYSNIRFSTKLIRSTMMMTMMMMMPLWVIWTLEPPTRNFGIPPKLPNRLEHDHTHRIVNWLRVILTN